MDIDSCICLYCKFPIDPFANLGFILIFSCAPTILESVAHFLFYYFGSCLTPFVGECSIKRHVSVTWVPIVPTNNMIERTDYRKIYGDTLFSNYYSTQLGRVLGSRHLRCTRIEMLSGSNLCAVNKTNMVANAISGNVKLGDIVLASFLEVYRSLLQMYKTLLKLHDAHVCATSVPLRTDLVHGVLLLLLDVMRTVLRLSLDFNYQQLLHKWQVRIRPKE
uniref:Uncharacterized protein n=1 Tax=Solanum lycopersicum TaxID=4081 RepID=A0A3Q7GSR0_SOLLC